MSGSLIPAANQVNAQVAGLTSNQVSVPIEPTTTNTELFHNLFNTNVGGLGYLFNHNVTHAVAAPIETATDSVRTSLGGFIRATRSFIQEHPLVTDGTPSVGAPASPIAPTLVDTLNQQVTKLRTFLGM
jgi:hypothetical protein